MICWNATKYKQDLQALTNISDSLLRFRKVHVPHFSDMKDTFFHIGQKHVSFQVSLLFVSHEEEDGWGRFRHNFNGFRSARNNMNIQRGVQEKEKFGVFSIWRENKERKFLTDLVEEVPFVQIFWGNLPLILQTHFYCPGLCKKLGFLSLFEQQLTMFPFKHLPNKSPNK